MSDKYKIHHPHAPYFITMTVVGWIDLFTRKEIKLQIVDSLKYCQDNKGLVIYAWCLMPGHMHIICSAKKGYKLTDIIRDFKKYTAKAILKSIREIKESRREWLFDLFRKHCMHLKRDQKFKIWRNGNRATLASNPFIYKQKLNYIHQNPVKDLIVNKPEDYLFSSTRNYAGMNGLPEVIINN